MERITEVTAELIALGSRSLGKQTVRVTVTTERGLQGSAALPGGISTGAGEAVLVEPAQALATIQSTVTPALIGQDALEQREVDIRLMELDETPERRQLGVNSLLPVSLAVARAAATALERELYEHLAELAGTEPRLPEPIQVMIEGGKHAEGSSVSIQELSVIGSVADGAAVLATIESLAASRSWSVAPGGEGGLVLGAPGNTEALQLLAEAAHTVNPTLKLALDVAASHVGTAAEVGALLTTGPIALVEDPVAQDDLAGWQAFTAAHGRQRIVAADDLTVGNPARIKDAVKAGVANCLVLKLNQTATLSELLDLAALVRVGNWKLVVSHRGQETEDPFIADLAVGLGAEYLKAGTVRSPERKTKYDRLAEIAKHLASVQSSPSNVIPS